MPDKIRRGDNHHPSDKLMWQKLHSALGGDSDSRTVVMHTVKNPDQPDTLVIMVTPAP